MSATISATPGAAAPAMRLRYPRRERKTLAYSALVLFSYYYFIRPEDFIGFLAYIPIARIMGAIALFALIFGAKPKERGRIPIELKVLLLLLGHMLLTIIFASWHGGAFEMVVNRFSKGVIVAFLIYLAVTKVDEIRKLLLIQAASIALVTVASVLIHHTREGRLMGIQKGILENPNDLAINVAISFPLCLAFLVGAKGVWSKLFWGVSLVFMMYAVVATYSRSGLIALVATMVLCFWEFVVRARHTYLVVGAFVTILAGTVVVLATPSYLTRVESIFLGNISGSQDKGSLEARKALLGMSLRLTEQHPIFGVGPGSFPAVSGTWQPAHNTYTGLSAETGLPGAILFTIVMLLSLHRTKRIEKLPGYANDRDVRLWTVALRAGMAAYILGAAFATTEYNLFEYFIVGYICVLYKIASRPPESNADAPTIPKTEMRMLRHENFRREPAWSR